MEKEFFVARPYYRVPAVQKWVLTASTVGEALDDHETGTCVAEETKRGGELVEELSEAEAISPERARALQQQTYTVIGFSANHPEGFTRVGTAGSPKGARLAFSEPTETVLAVLEGRQTNLL
jgi:hypothetical protein